MLTTILLAWQIGKQSFEARSKSRTRKTWIPGVGIYRIENSNEANNPTNGTVTLGPAPISRAAVEQEKKAKEEAFDRKRSAAGLAFDVPDEKLERDPHRAEITRADERSHPR